MEKRRHRKGKDPPKVTELSRWSGDESISTGRQPGAFVVTASQPLLETLSQASLLPGPRLSSGSQVKRRQWPEQKRQDLEVRINPNSSSGPCGSHHDKVLRTRAFRLREVKNLTVMTQEPLSWEAAGGLRWTRPPPPIPTQLHCLPESHLRGRSEAGSTCLCRLD